MAAILPGGQGLLPGSRERASKMHDMICVIWIDMDILGSDLFVRALIFWLDQADEKRQVGVVK